MPCEVGLVCSGVTDDKSPYSVHCLTVHTFGLFIAAESISAEPARHDVPQAASSTIAITSRTSRSAHGLPTMELGVRPGPMSMLYLICSDWRQKR